jgi:hypothetical protein
LPGDAARSLGRRGRGARQYIVFAIGGAQHATGLVALSLP